MLRFTVIGTPHPKGSMRAHNGPETKAWALCVRVAARDAMAAAGLAPVDDAVSVTLLFRLPRPCGHYTRAGRLKEGAPARPAVKPDVDKLVRNTLDALEGVVFSNDSRVVSLSAHKVYADDAEPGADIHVAVAGKKRHYRASGYYAPRGICGAAGLARVTRRREQVTCKGCLARLATAELAGGQGVNP